MRITDAARSIVEDSTLHGVASFVIIISSPADGKVYARFPFSGNIDHAKAESARVQSCFIDTVQVSIGAWWELESV